MPQTSAQTATSLGEETNLNPDRSANNAVIHVTLIMDGVTFDASDLHAALETQYGSGKVSNARDEAARSTYIFRVSA